MTSACANGTALGFDFSMAFQPIVNMAERRVIGCKALARGLGGESAGVVWLFLAALRCAAQLPSKIFDL